MTLSAEDSRVCRVGGNNERIEMGCQTGEDVLLLADGFENGLSSCGELSLRGLWPLDR